MTDPRVRYAESARKGKYRVEFHYHRGRGDHIFDEITAGWSVDKEDPDGDLPLAVLQKRRGPPANYKSFDAGRTQAKKIKTNFDFEEEHGAGRSWMDAPTAKATKTAEFIRNTTIQRGIAADGVVPLSGALEAFSVHLGQEQHFA